MSDEFEYYTSSFEDIGVDYSKDEVEEDLGALSSENVSFSDFAHALGSGYMLKDDSVSEGEVVSGSFEDCPYDCTDGKLFVPSLRKLVPCPHCSEIRKKIARGRVEVKTDKATEDGKTEAVSTNLLNILRIDSCYSGYTYSIEDAIPDMENMTDESVSEVRDRLDILMSKASLGEAPEFSLLFNLGAYADVLCFIYPYLIKCYTSGLRVTPLASTIELAQMRHEAEKSSYDSSADRKYGESYADYVDADICVLVADAGISLDGNYTIKGLMQARARKGKSTIIFTNAILPQVRGLYGSIKNKRNIAELVTIEYKKTATTQEPENATPVQAPSHKVEASFNSTDGRKSRQISMAELANLSKDITKSW